jgi:hypothetical protein
LVPTPTQQLTSFGAQRKEQAEALFCSELVALFYQQAGWMSKSVKAHHFLPKDFADYDNAHAEQYLRPGVSMGEMLIVTPPLAAAAAHDNKM